MTTSPSPPPAASLPATPRDPHFAQRVAASFAAQPAMALIGAQLHTVAPGSVVIELPCLPTLTQQHGYIHGGVIGMIADSAAGYAAATLTAADVEVLTVEYKINLLAPATGECLRAEGKVLRAGRQLTITAAEVYAINGSERRLCAVLQQTIMSVPLARA